MKKERYHLLDTIRGVVLVSMIIYHACWNFVYIYGRNWSWYQSKGAFFWQQSICWTFIFLSGFCFLLGRNSWKNGIMVFGGGMLVTFVTLLFMPSNRVIFGVLTCIGSCILLLSLGKNVMLKIPAEIGVTVTFLLFILMKKINSGFIGFGAFKVVELPEEWYQNYGTAFIGFPFPGFYSTDYFSLLPWCFLFLAGFYFFLIGQKKGWLALSFMKKGIAPLSFLGRHSLLIYLLHQPVLYALQQMVCG